MLHKIEQDYQFDKRRDPKIITPCCNKSNKDLKFVTYKGYPNNYGYCHSCGKTTLPPQIYKDEEGIKYYWNDNLSKFESVVSQINNPVLHVKQNCNTTAATRNTTCNTNDKKHVKFIDSKVVALYYKNPVENNLLLYLRSRYCNTKVDRVKRMYYIGTDNTGGVVFWNISKDQKVQKAKICYYKETGKRTSKFKVPYKNEDGYYSCLFGEHLLLQNKKPIVLVESEKTAIVAAIEMPQYTWLSYGGINGLTDKKLQPLKGKKITIIPDMSENAINIINKKTPYIKSLNIDVNVFDMTEGKNDDELKKNGWYNCDLEDIFRKIN